jgi:pimeloyl-ACP methyl ester carboxylesterase
MAIILLLNFPVTYVMGFDTEVVHTGELALERYVPDGAIKPKRILFIHSSGHGSWMWKNFLSYFAERGYDSWALNLRGHYLSQPVKDWGEVGLNEYLEDIDQAVKRIGENIVLVGHSMSGLLVLKYAESHEVAGLIVSQAGAPMPVLQKRGVDLKGMVPSGKKKRAQGTAIMPLKDRRQVMAKLFDEGNVDEGAVDLVLENMGEESVRASGEIMRMELSPEKISAPIYVLGFDLSKLGAPVPADPGKILAEEVSARDFKVIEPGGHDYMLEKNWKDFARQFELWIGEE